MAPVNTIGSARCVFIFSKLLLPGQDLAIHRPFPKYLMDLDLEGSDENKRSVIFTRQAVLFTGG
jgi:hypothetical protein